MEENELTFPLEIYPTLIRQPPPPPPPQKKTNKQTNKYFELPQKLKVPKIDLNFKFQISELV